MKYGILSLLACALVCFSLSSCGDKKGANDAGNKTDNKTDILTGTKYVYTMQNQYIILEFQAGGKCVFKNVDGNNEKETFKGDYTVEGTKVSIKITWVGEGGDLKAKDQTFIGNLKEDNKKISINVAGTVLDFIKQ